MSHELRTPLTTMLGYTQLIMLQFDQKDDAETYECATNIERAGSLLKGLIDDVLDLYDSAACQPLHSYR